MPSWYSEILDIDETNTEEWACAEAVVRKCCLKKVYLEISQNSRENTCARVSLLKKTLAQMFSCQFRNISKNTFYYKQLRWLLLCLTDFADGYSQETNTCSKSVTEIEKTVEYAQK